MLEAFAIKPILVKFQYNLKTINIQEGAREQNGLSMIRIVAGAIFEKQSSERTCWSQWAAYL